MHDIFFTQSGKTAGHGFENIDPSRTQYEALNFFHPLMNRIFMLSWFWNQMFQIFSSLDNPIRYPSWTLMYCYNCFFSLLTVALITISNFVYLRNFTFHICTYYIDFIIDKCFDWHYFIVLYIFIKFQFYDYICRKENKNCIIDNGWRCWYLISQRSSA